MFDFSLLATDFEITGVVGFVHRPGLKKLNAAFRKLGLFPSSGEGRKTPAVLGPLERANILSLVK
jgi:hypothetical protein